MNVLNASFFNTGPRRYYRVRTPYEIGQVAVTLILIMVFALCSESLAPYRNLWGTWISGIDHIVVFLGIFMAYVDDGKADRGNEKGYGRAFVADNLCWTATVVAKGVATVCSGIPITERLPRRVSVPGDSLAVKLSNLLSLLCRKHRPVGKKTPISPGKAVSGATTEALCIDCRGWPLET